MGMTKEEFLAEVARIHTGWAPTATVVVDPRYAGKSPSQYTEGIQDVSATPESDQSYIEQVNALMDEYDRSNGRPTRAERLAEYKAKRGVEGPSVLGRRTNPAKGRPTEGG